MSEPAVEYANGQPVDPQGFALADAVAAARPLVLRGLCRDWPLVQAARRSHGDFAQALAALDNGSPVDVLHMPPDAEGVVGYNPEIDGFNYRHFKVGVTEALQRLAQEGLVAIQHGGATKVTDFRRSGQLHLLPRLLVNDAGGIDKTVVRSVVEMRAALAPDIARLAAGRALPEHIERAESAMQTMDDPATTPPERSVVNLDMWDALVDASDNIAYRFAYNSLRSCFEPVAGLLADTLAVELNDVDGRRALLTAIRHGDAGAAADAAVALLAPSNSALTQLIGEL